MKYLLVGLISVISSNAYAVDNICENFSEKLSKCEVYTCKYAHPMFAVAKDKDPNLDIYI